LTKHFGNLIANDFDEPRTVRLCERAFKTLLTLEPKPSGSVFTYRGKAIESMDSAFSATCKGAGFTDVHFHDLRHTFASRLVQGGVPLYEVMTMLGHKSLAMVVRYAHHSLGCQDTAIRALNSFGHNLVIADETG